MQTTKPESVDRPNPLRRKLFRGASGGVGVLLAVHAKTALGAACASPSGMVSGNTSPRTVTGVVCSGGLSPGYWKVPQHNGSWPVAGATFPTFTKSVNLCTASGMKNLTLGNLATTGTTFGQCGFTGVSPAGSELWKNSIWAVLAFPGSFSGGQLLRHCVAAWLNAGKFNLSSQKYPLSKAQVIAMWDATKSGGYYCPTGGTCTAANGWSAIQVTSYIEGMYDLNASGGDPPLCESP